MEGNPECAILRRRGWVEIIMSDEEARSYLEKPERGVIDCGAEYLAKRLRGAGAAKVTRSWRVRGGTTSDDAPPGHVWACLGEVMYYEEGMLAARTNPCQYGRRVAMSSAEAEAKRFLLGAREGDRASGASIAVGGDRVLVVLDPAFLAGVRPGTHVCEMRCYDMLQEPHFL
jgi:hypothetical protein